MATIKINDTQLDAALSKAGDRLTLTLTNATLPLDELAALFDPGATPEVRVVDDAGLTTAIYSNRRVIEVSAQLDGGDVRRAVVGLQVQPIEQSVAEQLQERVEAQAAMIAQQGQTITAQQMTIDSQAATIVEQQRQINDHEVAETLLKAQVQALSERGDFVEDCIAEMAMQVY